MTAKVVSFINLKGGVGKSTLAMIVAEFLVFRHFKRVLLIDFDPQYNLTAAMVNQHSFDELRGVQKRTLYNFFQAVLEGQQPAITDFIATPPLIVSNIARWSIQTTSARLDMVIAVPDLGLLDEEMLEMWEKGQRPPQRLRFVLREALGSVLRDYNAVIIDCPPGLSFLTSAAIVASDYFVAPVIPEPLSLIGIDMVQTRIATLKERYPQDGVNIEFAGSILNKVLHYRRTHIFESARLYGGQVGPTPPRPEYVARYRNYQAFRWWVPDTDHLRKVGEFECELLAAASSGTGPTKFDNIREKYDLNYRLTNPKVGLLDRSGEEGGSYRLYERLNRREIEQNSRGIHVQGRSVGKGVDR